MVVPRRDLVGVEDRSEPHAPPDPVFIAATPADSIGDRLMRLVDTFETVGEPFDGPPRRSDAPSLLLPIMVFPPPQVEPIADRRCGHGKRCALLHKLIKRVLHKLVEIVVDQFFRVAVSVPTPYWGG
jgi:hypothetical protein